MFYHILISKMLRNQTGQSWYAVQLYHIYTQQLFNFQKIIFLLIPPCIHPQRPTSTIGLFVNVWLHIHPTAGMEKGGMSAILCNRSLWSHLCSSKISMRLPWTLFNCIWRFSALQRRYLTFGDISVRWRWVKWFSKTVFAPAKPLFWRLPIHLEVWPKPKMSTSNPRQH